MKNPEIVPLEKKHMEIKEEILAVFISLKVEHGMGIKHTVELQKRK